MIDSVVDAISTDKDVFYEVDSTMYTRRVSLVIDEKYLEKYLSNLEIPYETDISKLRISASAYSDCSEIVVTPMFCPICDDVASVEMENILFYLSEKFISEHRVKIIGRLKENGFTVIKDNLIPHTADDSERQQR